MAVYLLKTTPEFYLLAARPEIPWKAVKGMRDHIAHGYFDINILTCV